MVFFDDGRNRPDEQRNHRAKLEQNYNQAKKSAQRAGETGRGDPGFRDQL